MTTKLNFEVESAEIIAEPVDSQFATARIRAFNTGKSLHDTWCNADVLERTAFTLYEKPIIFELDNRFGDFGTHNEGVTVPAGFVVPNSATYVEEQDGRISLNVLAKIWKRYSGKFLEVFADTETRRKSVSVEMEVLQTEDMSNGLTNLLDFAYSAICVLGDYITPASPQSEIEMLTFATQQKSDYQEAFMQEFASRYDEIDFEIPASIKRAVTRALKMHETSGGGSPVSLAHAKYISTSAEISPERLRTLYKRFQKANEMDEITLALWGGRGAARWAKELMAQMSEADEQEVRYFSREKENISLEDTEMEERAMAKDKSENDVTEPVETEAIQAPAAETETPVGQGAEAPPAQFAANEEQSEEQNMAEEEEKFSYGELFQQDELMSFFAEEEEDDEDTKAKFGAAREEYAEGKNVKAMMSAMFAAMKKMQAKMGRMAADAEVYMAENKDLKEFKAETEAKQKEFAIAETMRELSEKANVPDDVKQEIIAEAQKHTLETLDDWKNFAKAKCFDFAKPEKSEEEEKIEVIGFSFYEKVTPATDLWAN